MDRKSRRFPSRKRMPHLVTGRDLELHSPLDSVSLFCLAKYPVVWMKDGVNVIMLRYEKFHVMCMLNFSGSSLKLNSRSGCKYEVYESQLQRKRWKGCAKQPCEGCTHCFLIGCQFNGKLHL
jgi:hypothetical protein